MDQEKEEQLVERLRAGDSQALGDLFEAERSRLARMVHYRLDNRLHGRVDTDDVLQEAFLAAHDRLHHFVNDWPHSFFGWLRLIVGQTIIDVHRRHLLAKGRDVRREVSRLPSVGPQTTSMSLAKFLSGSLTSPSQAAMKKEARKKLEECLEQMDPIDREVLSLRHFEELSNNEVSEALEITPKAASMRYVRAIRRMKTVLEELDPPTSSEFAQS